MSVICQPTHDWFSDLLATGLIVGLFISYAPQHFRIINKGSSEGFSPWFLLLGSTSAASGMLNMIVMQWGVIRCCHVYTAGDCLETIAGVLQVISQWFLFTVIFALYMTYYPPSLKYATVAVDAHDSRPTQFLKTNIKTDEWRLSIILSWVTLIHIIFITFVTFFLLLTHPIDPSGEIRSRQLSIWATFLGVTSGILAAMQYAPQLAHTYRHKVVGALSIPMMLIQSPGGFIMVLSIALRPGTNWTSWIQFLVAAMMQAGLLVMCIFWKFRQQRLHIDDFGHPLPSADVPPSPNVVRGPEQDVPVQEAVEDAVEGSILETPVPEADERMPLLNKSTTEKRGWWSRPRDACQISTPAGFEEHDLESKSELAHTALTKQSSFSLRVLRASGRYSPTCRTILCDSSSIKNRAPAAVQITAEQLLREAQERQEAQFTAPKQRVEDFEELNEYRGRKRKEFEERIRRTRGSIKEWLQYANWEASQSEFARARSIFERALDVDPRSVQLWLSYTEMELKARNVQHARNLFDRAVTLLPRIDQLWYKYVYLEELLQNVAARARCSSAGWPGSPTTRHGRRISRWRPEPRVWVKWGKFEEERGKVDKAREVFQTALEFFGDEEEQVDKAQAVFSNFAKMETRLKEFERARVIYKFALSRLPRSKSANLYAAYTKFEKQHGTRTSLESTVLGKRRIQYEEELSHDGRNYDVWFDYARLEEGAYRQVKEEGATTEEEEQAIGRVREVYERAVSQVPPGGEKRHWRRYIFLWLDYALFEEIETKDYPRARQIYQTAIQLVPHKQFTFAKLWIMYARFEVRMLDLPAARKILGAAIGMCPKEALFKGYIQLEFDLREFDRVRTLYEKYLEFDPTNSTAWIKYAELETQLADYGRARGIFELGVAQSPLSMPELLWKAYIDFEVDEGEREKARALYERLVGISGHWKAWVAFALFEAQAMQLPRDEREEEEEEEDEEAEVKMVDGDLEIARQVFQRGYKDLKSKGLKNERVALLQVWKNFEEENGTPDDVAKLTFLACHADYDYIFADDEREANPTSFKFLQMAHAWKAKKAADPSAAPLSGFTAAKAAEVEQEQERDGAARSKRRDDAMEVDDDGSSDVASSHGGD
ncbi:hypothetical protein EVG20_g9917 [Dentipellis fragilis]|uniref:Suppressor of forked domain-containing protein n=1 Tax=Dentipellis fragilis TaxID=205917 RepID=A0A4Y9XUS8_9AGAM|nr:hypothetical protein EVG20_g9917 [Dentipellis fragilis]